MDAWTFLWLMLFLKIPIVALFLIVRWAVKQTPEGFMDQDGGIGPRPGPRHPHRPRRWPSPPRRGPHAGPVPLSPPRMRAATAMRHRRPRV